MVQVLATTTSKELKCESKLTPPWRPKETAENELALTDSPVLPISIVCVAGKDAVEQHSEQNSSERSFLLSRSRRTGHIAALAGFHDSAQNQSIHRPHSCGEQSSLHAVGGKRPRKTNAGQSNSQYSGPAGQATNSRLLVWNVPPLLRSEFVSEALHVGTGPSFFTVSANNCHACGRYGRKCCVLNQAINARNEFFIV